MAHTPSGARPDPTALEVDRLLAELARSAPPPPPPRLDDRSRATSPPRAAASRSGSNGKAPSRRPDRRPMLGLWIRVVLGASLGIMMSQWPYPHECGWPLGGYLASVGIVVLTGAWIAFTSWRLRSGPAHLLALVLVFWGLVLAAEETYPRVGEPASRAGWQCG